MKVDFDGLRKQTAFAMDDLIKELNAGLMPDRDYSMHTDPDNPEGKLKEWKGNVLIDSEDIQKVIDELRHNIVILCCCYKPGEDGYSEVWTEVEKSGGIARFNDEPNKA